MLLQVHKSAKKPAWQKGMTAPTPEIRAALSIISRNEQAFSRAFLRTIRTAFSERYMRPLKQAIRDSTPKMSIEEILAFYPWYNEADPAAVAFWENMSRSLVRAYSSTIEDSGSYTARHYNFPMRFKVAKAEIGIDIVVPINPYSEKWIRSRSAQLVVDISNGQRERLRSLLARNFERGIRPEAGIEGIEEILRGTLYSEMDITAGLTETQSQWVVRRQDLMIAQGTPPSVARLRVKEFADRLLRTRAKTIARTETVDAHTKGLEDSWQLAQDNGLMPEGTEKVWISFLDNRTSEICEELHDVAVPVGQPFESSYVGSIDRPPAHPNCRSTMILRFP